MAENQVADTEYFTAEHATGDPRSPRAWMVAAFLLGAIACDALGSPEAVGRAVEHALDMPEAGKMLFPLFVLPAPDGEPARLFEPPDRRREPRAALPAEAVERPALSACSPRPYRTSATATPGDYGHAKGLRR